MKTISRQYIFVRSNHMSIYAIKQGDLPNSRDMQQKAGCVRCHPPNEQEARQTIEEATSVSELLVIGFRDQYRASEVFNELRRREWDWVAELDQALVVRVNEQGRLRVQFTVDPTSYAGVAWARAWSGFLRLIVPIQTADGLIAVTQEMVGERDSRGDDPFLSKSTDSDLSWWRESIRVPQQFVRDVGALVRPGTSNLLLLLRSSEASSVLNRLRDYSSTILHTPLTQEQDSRLESLLAME
jgi:uncharacterized membrane protein